MRQGHARLTAPSIAALVVSATLLTGVDIALAQTGAAPPPPSTAPARIPAATFFNLPRLRDVTLSPSGRYLAAIVPSKDERMALGVVDLETMAPPVVVASFDNGDLRDAWWVSEDWLAFDVYDAQSGGMDQPRGSGLFSVRRDGGAIRTLIRTRRDLVRGLQAAGVPPLEPGHYVLEPRAGGNTLIVGEVHSGPLGEVEFVTPKRLDVATGRASVIVSDAPHGSVGWLFDASGEPRVAVSLVRGEEEVFWHAPGVEGWKSLARFDALEGSGFEPIHVDRRGELLVRTRSGEGFAQLRTFDFDRGRPADQEVITTPGFDFDGVPIVDLASDRLVGFRVKTDASTTVWFDAHAKEFQKDVDRRLPDTVNDITCRRCDGADAVVLVHSYSDRDPGFYTLYRPKDQAWQSIGRSHPDVDPARMAKLDFYRFKSRDGLDMPVWVTTPSEPSTGPRAAVVLVHGGPWVRGGEWRWNPTAQFLASRGYVVIEPEYRGSTGFGYQHFRLGWKHWGTTMQDDVADAVAWAASKSIIDPKRVCIAGASYGGYATLMGVVRYPDTYRCGIAWVGVSDPRLMFEESWANDYSVQSQRYSLPRLIGDPKTDSALLDAASPVLHAQEIKTPLLLAYGRDDRRVPIEHGTSMRTALRKAGQEPQWVVYEGEGHGWLKVSNKIDWAERMQAFLRRYNP